MELLNWFTIGRLGLLYDLMGAFILLWGFVSQGKSEFIEADSFYRDGEVVKSITTKWDSVIGLIFISVGFSAQLASTEPSWVAAFSSCGCCAVVGLTILIVIGGSYLLLRKMLFARYIVYINKGSVE